MDKALNEIKLIKNTSADELDDANKKKRGRPRKDSPCGISATNVPVTCKKKKGRKPKDVTKIRKKFMEKQEDEHIVLHLKLTKKDIRQFEKEQKKKGNLNVFSTNTQSFSFYTQTQFTETDNDYESKPGAILNVHSNTTDDFGDDTFPDPTTNVQINEVRDSIFIKASDVLSNTTLDDSMLIFGDARPDSISSTSSSSILNDLENEFNVIIDPDDTTTKYKILKKSYKNVTDKLKKLKSESTSLSSLPINTTEQCTSIDTSRPSTLDHSQGLSSYNIHNSTNDSLVCWHCTYSFDNIPAFIIDRKVNETLDVFGTFCCFNCAIAYNLSMNDYRMWDRHSIMISMCKKIFGDVTIIPSPSKECLQKYGGKLSIEVYRQDTFYSNKEYHLVLPPVNMVCAKIHEINIVSNNQNNNTNDKNSQIHKQKAIIKPNTVPLAADGTRKYDLCRTKPLPPKNTGQLDRFIKYVKK